MPNPGALLEDPTLFLAMEDLSLAAHGIVEGALQGLHRSPFRGFGAEFDSHREYQPGDDLRYLNWNLFASHGRLFTKQFRTETNLNLYLLLDATGSMATERGPAPKFRYAARAAAALALLARKTRDAAGLYLLQDGLLSEVPPRSRPGHFEDLLATLETARPANSGNLGAAVQDVLNLCRRRGIVVVLSDFFDEEETLLHGLIALRQQGHDVLAFQVLDPWEVALPDHGDFEFNDLESGGTLRTSAPGIREAYAQVVNDWRLHLQGQCEGAGIAWSSVLTTDPLAEVLVQFLLRRTRP